MAYGDKRDYPKIELFVKTSLGWNYIGTTTWAKTCKEAVERYKADNVGLIVKAQFKK
jgi:hypothetical protein